ncbi:CASP-like protein 5A2 [Ziziphus jujuba]|uniref:CASP-like protein n=1 Tax=Ziziphus jujuba TaxID=326968 RepID=A0ABM3IDD8_ZIZJJ|nr:CASP-like protein 5A2 [Ziziphus jujuba]
MNASRPSVHPVEAPPPATDAAAGENPLPRGRMKDIQGMPGTRGGLALRLSQFAFAVVALCIMASTSDFPSVTAFRCLVAAASLQSLWSLSLAIIDIYAILVRRSLRNFRVVSIFAMGDGITSTLIFSAACASAGITVLIGNDLNDCAQNHCARFETATAMAFMSWFAVSPSFLLNFWTLASK